MFWVLYLDYANNVGDVFIIDVFLPAASFYLSLFLFLLLLLPSFSDILDFLDFLIFPAPTIM